jgi:hypothetical protein
VAARSASEAKATQVSVLTVSHVVRRTQQFSVPRELPRLSDGLSIYQKLKDAIEEICKLNHELPRPDPASRKSRRKRRD